MTDINPDFIEKYQNIYERDPNSKVFAPLAEAYRRMGLFAQAIRVAERGTKAHPDFPSGHMALAKCYIDTDRFDDAVVHLKKTTELAPENLMAHRLHADCLFKLRRAKESLTAYKMVLYLYPKDAKARKIIKKLESLTADEFSDDVFESFPKDSADFLTKRFKETSSQSSASFRGLDRFISLIDAFIVRNDLERAELTIKRAEQDYPGHPEVEQRRQILVQRAQDVIGPDAESIEPLESRAEIIRKQKIELLNHMLRRISTPVLRG